MDLLQRFRDSSPETPVVLLTAFGSLETAIQAMKQGAFDYITKPVNLEELALVMNRAVQHHRLVRDHRHLSRAFDERVRAASFVGQSHAMVEVFKLVGKVASGRTSVLIQGESGTGKEVIARAIHDNSARAARLFVAMRKLQRDPGCPLRKRTVRPCQRLVHRCRCIPAGLTRGSQWRDALSGRGGRSVFGGAGEIVAGVARTKKFVGSAAMRR